MMRRKKTAQITVRIYSMLKDAAEKAAAQDHRSLTALIERLLSRDTRHAVISQHQIGRKSILVSLGSLVLDGLVHRAYTAIENCFHCSAFVPARESPR